MAQRQWRSDDTDTWNEAFGDGSDGAYSTAGSLTDSSRSGYANTTFAGTASGTSGTAGSGTGFSAGDLVLIHQSRDGGDGAGVWELNKISSTGSGTDWTMAYDLMNTYATTGQVYRLPQYSSVDINSGHTLTSVAWNGTVGGIVAFICNGTTTIAGTITGVAKGFRGGAAGTNEGSQGEGTAGAGSAGANTANGNGGGAGGYAPGGAAAGTGGSAVGAASLVTMDFGGASGGTNGGATGKNGGGIVLIISKTITVTGAINVSGTAGSNGASDTAPTGGSAGGSALFKGQAVTLGSSLITADAGAKGTGGSTNTRGSGGGGYASAGGNGGTADAGAGSPGRIHADYSTSISGTTSPTLDSTLDTTIVEPVAASGATGYSFFM